MTALARCCLALLLAAALAWPAHAQDYPSRPVKIVISITAGAGPDVITRVVAEHLGKLWGQQVVVENRPGAGGAIAVRAAGTSTPDGYTLYVAVASNFLALPEMLAKLPFDVARDFVPIGFVGAHPMVIGASTELGVQTLPELIALAKRRPGELNIGIIDARVAAASHRRMAAHGRRHRRHHRALSGRAAGARPI